MVWSLPANLLYGLAVIENRHLRVEKNDLRDITVAFIGYDRVLNFTGQALPKIDNEPARVRVGAREAESAGAGLRQRSAGSLNRSGRGAAQGRERRN